MGRAVKNILPDFAEFNVGDGCLVDSKGRSDVFTHVARSKSALYVYDGIRRKLGVRCIIPGGSKLFQRRAAVVPMEPYARLSTCEVRDGFDRDAVFIGKFCMAHTRDIVFEKADDASVGKAHVACSSLLRGIGHVVASRSSRQVRRIYTSRIIARMHDMHSVWDIAKDILVGKPMRKFLADYGAKAKHAVALVVPVGLPFPAFGFGLYGDLGPKTMIKHSLIKVGFPPEVKW